MGPNSQTSSPITRYLPLPKEGAMKGRNMLRKALRPCSWCVGIHLAMVMSPTLGWAGALVFGPQTFIKGPGGPETFQVTFPVDDPRGTFWLQVFNGANGENLVKNGRIRLNGVEVAEASDFREATRLQFHFTKDVTLQAVNVLEVELRGKEGNLITIEIRRAKPNMTVSNARGDLSGQNLGDSVGLWWGFEPGASTYVIFKATSIDGPWMELDRFTAEDPKNAVDFTQDARLKDLCYKIEALDASGHVIRRYGPICVPKFVEPESQDSQGSLFLHVSGEAVVASPAVDESPFNTMCLSDKRFVDTTTMSLDDIRQFLKERRSFLQEEIEDVDKVKIDPAKLLFDVAQANQINLQVLLTTLQKEQSAITSSDRLSDERLKLITGYDGSSTIRDQISGVAAQFRLDFDRLTQGDPTAGGWQVSVSKESLDKIMVTPASKTVAVLFSYTPWVGEGWGGRKRIGGNSLFCKVWSDFGFAEALPKQMWVAIGPVGAMLIYLIPGVEPEMITLKYKNVRNLVIQYTGAEDDFETIGVFKRSMLNGSQTEFQTITLQLDTLIDPFGRQAINHELDFIDEVDAGGYLCIASISGSLNPGAFLADDFGFQWRECPE